jgi:hypothetical protein
VVIRSVLGFILNKTDIENTTKVAKAIYNDQFLGMNSPSKLFFWLQALEGKKGSYIYNLVQTYFISKGINLDDALMAKIIGPQNMLAQIYNTQRSLAYKLYQNDSSNNFNQDILW